MKKWLIIFLTLTIIAPLFAQEKKPSAQAKKPPAKEIIPWEHEIPWDVEPEEPEEEIIEEVEEKIEEPKEIIPFTFARRFFEIGVDVGVGVDNDLVGIHEIFRKNITFNMSELGSKTGPDGFNINLGLLSGMFIHFMNLKIARGRWDIGIDSCVDGGLHVNIPESLIVLLWKGNYRRTFGGMINASGGIYADVGLSTLAKYNKLRIGVRPSTFTPVVFIPKSGIDYSLETTDETLELTAIGSIKIYSPVIDYMEDRGLELTFGSDISLTGEYDLLSMLGIGVSISNIPLAPAEMEKRTLVTMKDINLLIEGEKLLKPNSEEDGNEMELPDFDYNIEYDIAPYKVYRPLRFDLYALYRPFGNWLLVKPSVGFTVDLNDNETYFNFGAEARINLLKNLLLFRIATRYDDAVWKHRLGLGVNFRLFELDIEGVLRSQSFTGSYSGRGIGVNVGIRFGW
jgi:hypothetical protein